MIKIKVRAILGLAFVAVVQNSFSQSVRYLALSQPSTQNCFAREDVIKPTEKALCDDLGERLRKYTDCGYGGNNVVSSANFAEPAYDPNGALSYYPYPFGGCFVRIDRYNGSEYWGQIYYDGGGGGQAMFRIGEIDRHHSKSCQPSLGHPIQPLTGAKTLKESLLSFAAEGLRLELLYDTRSKIPGSNLLPVSVPVSAWSFGELWSSSIHKSLKKQESVSLRAQTGMQALRGGGNIVSFTLNGSGAFVPDGDISDRLLKTSDGWIYFDASSQAEEVYNAAGQLLSVAYVDGALLTYKYSDDASDPSVAPVTGLIVSVIDQKNRSIAFKYEQPPGSGQPRVTQVIGAGGQVLGLGYDSNGNLSRVNWSDGTSRNYFYERNDIPWAVTGVVDENMSRLATYGYDVEGRANDTQWAGGVDRYLASYTTPPGWDVVQTLVMVQFDSANVTFGVWSVGLPRARCGDLGA